MIDPIAPPKAALSESEVLVQFAPAIAKYSYKFHARVVGLGAPMTLEDISQELSIVLIKCHRAFDPAAGSTFLNYLITSWFHTMNAMLRKDQRNLEEAYTLRADASEHEDDEMSGTMFDRVDSGWATPEENCEALQAIEEALSQLSPDARTLVEILMDPPPVVCEQFALQDKGVTSRRQLGTGICRTNKQLDFKFLCSLFSISVPKARRLKAEIDRTVGAAFNFARA